MRRNNGKRDEILDIWDDRQPDLIRREFPAHNQPTARGNLDVIYYPRASAYLFHSSL